MDADRVPYRNHKIISGVEREERVEKENKQLAERKEDGEETENSTNSMCWISPVDMCCELHRSHC